MSPEQMDSTTKAATDEQSESPLQSCAECGWPFGPDLTLEWILGRPSVVCSNAWKCWERQQHLDLEPPQGLGLVQVVASK